MSSLTHPEPAAPVSALPARTNHTEHGRTDADARCAACSTAETVRLLDLGRVPVLAEGDATGGEVAPMRLCRCPRCGVLQLEGPLCEEHRARVATATEYRAFAGRPDLARRFCEDAIDRWKLTGDGHVIEVGSGTGSLLRFFRAWQLPVLGLEPDAQLTRYARLRRVPTWRAGFDAALAGRIARSDTPADLLIISTPLGACASLPELFAAASTVLRPGGVVTFELPDVLRLVGRTRFDSLRHAERVIASIGQLQRIVAPFGLDVVDVERAEMADDRLRVWLRSRQHGASAVGHPRLRTRLRAEAAAGIERAATVDTFVRRATIILRQVRALLDDAARNCRTVAAYGASADAATIASVVGVTSRDVAYALDPIGVGEHRDLPGTDVPVVADDAQVGRPDLVLGLDDLGTVPDAWRGLPVYAVADLVDVVHRLTTEHTLHYAR